LDGRFVLDLDHVSQDSHELTKKQHKIRQGMKRVKRRGGRGLGNLQMCPVLPQL
jgi:hypothetical protein